MAVFESTTIVLDPVGLSRLALMSPRTRMMPAVTVELAKLLSEEKLPPTASVSRFDPMVMVAPLPRLNAPPTIVEELSYAMTEAVPVEVRLPAMT